MKIKKFLHASPAFSIVQTGQQLGLQIDRFLEAEELNFLQALILVSIFFEPGKKIRPKELPSTFKTTKANVSHCLKHLERKKLVERKPVSTDARGFLIEITPKGGKCCLRLIDYFDRLQNECERVLTEKGTQELVDQIHAIEAVYRNAHK